MTLSKIICWFRGHDWKFTLNFIQEPDYDMPCGMHYGSNHYSGTCQRCGKRDLFRGPYDPSQKTQAA